MELRARKSIIGGEKPADAGPNRHPGDLIKMKVLIQQVWVAPEIPQC